MDKCRQEKPPNFYNTPAGSHRAIQPQPTSDNPGHRTKWRLYGTWFFKENLDLLEDFCGIFSKSLIYCIKLSWLHLLKGKPVVNVDVLKFIQSCVVRQRIRWTYHVNMRLRGRFIPREAILTSADCYEIIEEYSKDRYLPSYLIRGEYKHEIIHVLIAVDMKSDCVTIVTAYKPSPAKWEDGFRKRRE